MEGEAKEFSGRLKIDLDVFEILEGGDVSIFVEYYQYYLVRETKSAF